MTFWQTINGFDFALIAALLVAVYKARGYRQAWLTIKKQREREEELMNEWYDDALKEPLIGGTNVQTDD